MRLIHLLLAVAMLSIPFQSVAAQTLRVMTFNVRLPSPDDGANRWEHRRDLMVRTIRRLASQPALACELGEELLPGAHVQTDTQILDEVRRLSRAGTHAVGSCAMGGAEAALDPACRVRGVDGVREGAVVGQEKIVRDRTSNKDAHRVGSVWVEAGGKTRYPHP